MTAATLPLEEHYGAVEQFTNGEEQPEMMEMMYKQPSVFERDMKQAEVEGFLILVTNLNQSLISYDSNRENGLKSPRLGLHEVQHGKFSKSEIDATINIFMGN